MGTGYRPDKKFLGTNGYRVPAREKFLGTDGYRVTARKKFFGTDGYRVPARKNFLGTDGYRVPAKFSTMPTPAGYNVFAIYVFHVIKKLDNTFL